MARNTKLQFTCRVLCIGGASVAAYNSPDWSSHCKVDAIYLKKTYVWCTQHHSEVVH